MSHADEPVPARPPVRAGDADREHAAEQLRTAVAEGRLDLAELDERLTAVYAARTQAELAAVTADLPAQRKPDPRPLTLRTRSGSQIRTGHWEVPPRIDAECTSGSIKLDFSEAVCPHAEVTVQVSVSSGSVVLLVPPGWGVLMDDVSTTSGTVANKVRERPDPSAPVVRVSGRVKSGVVTAKVRDPNRVGFWRRHFGRRGSAGSGSTTSGR